MVEIGNSIGDRGCEEAVEAPGAAGRPVLGEGSHLRGQKLGEGEGRGTRQKGRRRAGRGRRQRWRRRRQWHRRLRERPPQWRAPPPPVGATTSLAVATHPVREPPPGSVEGDGVEETCSTCSLSAAVAVEEATPVADAAPPAGATTSLVAATLLLREPPPGIVEDDGVEETRAARPLSAAVAVRCCCNCGWCLPARNCNAFLTSGWSSLGGGGCCRVGLATGPKTAAEAAAADSRVEGGPPGCAGRSKGPLGCRRRGGQL
jgi:hypothetical protein